MDKTFHIRVSQDAHNRLKALAFLTGVGMSEIIRASIEELVAKRDSEIKDLLAYKLKA